MYNLPEMVYINQGLLIRGSDFDDTDTFKNELHNDRFEFVPHFKISKYPITNNEYKRFIEDLGYQNDVWWDIEGTKWKEGRKNAHSAAVKHWVDFILWLKSQDFEKIANERQWREERKGFIKETLQKNKREIIRVSQAMFKRNFNAPAFWENNIFNLPDHPVVGINWYEAKAFCSWLSSKTNLSFSLPTEIQWEYAARGNDRRKYPWGNIFDTSMCNTLESCIYKTTPVDKYINGISPFGVMDMVGNVWEWTSDTYLPINELDSFKEEGYVVVKGGSWDNNRRYARCACRDKDVPVIFGDRLGFRIVENLI